MSADESLKYPLEHAIIDKPDVMIWEAEDVFLLTMDNIDKTAKEHGFDAPTVKLFHAFRSAAPP